MSHLHEPDWVQHWASRGPVTPSDAGTTHAIITGVRAGNTLEEVEAMTGLGRKSIFAVVAAVGARCTQIAKDHTRALEIHRGSPGSPIDIVHTKAGPVLTAADGWVRSRREGDIRRSYAATVLAEETVVAAAITRWLETSDDKTVNYTHFADLHAASRGVLPPLHEVVATPSAAAAYLAAWHQIDTTVAQASRAAAALLRSPTPQAALAATRTAFWMLPNATALAHWSKVCTEATTSTTRTLAEQRLRHQLVALRHLSARQPAKLNPVRLEQLTVEQMRVIAALHGHHPTDGAAARTETLFEEFAAAASRQHHTRVPVPA